MAREPRLVSANPELGEGDCRYRHGPTEVRVNTIGRPLGLDVLEGLYWDKAGDRLVGHEADLFPCTTAVFEEAHKPDYAVLGDVSAGSGARARD